ncbi:MAG: discoidin domain-containing protein [Rikenellaceae bacterium]|nr:discoidin domain-containing protein [Rikenellaceae bacterium]
MYKIGLLFTALLLCGPLAARQSLIKPAKVKVSSEASAQAAAAMAVDGDYATCWTAASADGQQSFWVDLRDWYALDRIVQTFDESSVWKFVIEGSVDNKHWFVLSDHSKGSAGVTFGEPVSGVWRYVRLTVDGSADGLPASSRELAVYGSKQGPDLARGAQVEATSWAPYYEPGKAADGNFSTYWGAAEGTFPQSITFDLGAVKKISGVRQVFKDHDPWKFVIEGSVDGERWTMIDDRSAGELGHDFRKVARGDYRFVRLTVLGSASDFWAHSCEFEVYGDKLDRKAPRDLSRDVTARASSIRDVRHSQYAAIDGADTTAWLAADNTYPQTLTLDLGHTCRVDRIVQEFAEAGRWSFELAGSHDGTQWTLLRRVDADRPQALFDQKVAGDWRYVRLTVLDSPEGYAASSRALDVTGTGSPVQTRWWADQSGMCRYYCKIYRNTIREMIDDLDDLQAQGFKMIELSSVYEGKPEIWGGLGGTNNYAIDPMLGTMDEFEEFLDEAHKRDIKIVFFGNVGYCLDEAPFFRKACDDYRNGIESKERDWFHFSPDSLGHLWFWSDRAQAYYYSFWGHTDGARGRIPSYCFHKQAWRDECSKYLKYWAEKGVDGIFLDAPEVYDGIDDQIIGDHIINAVLPHSLISCAEGSGDPRRWLGRLGFNTIQGFDMYGWGGGGRSEALIAMRKQDPSELNLKLKLYRDATNAVGGVTLTPPMWETAATPAERAFETAYLVASGTLLANHFGDYHLVGQDIIAQWPKEDQERFFRLIRMQNAYRGLAPSGQRVVLPTNDDKKFTAIKRSNQNGKVNALVIFNFQDTPQSVTVGLRNSGINVGQTPVNLIDGTAAAPILSEDYTVSLPAYGYLFLGVED